MKSLGSSKIYSVATMDKSISSIMSTVDLDKATVSYEEAMDNVKIIHKRYSDPYRNKALQDFKTGRVKLLVDADKLTQIPKPLLFWSSKENGQIVTYVNATYFAKRLQKTGEFSCSNPAFYTMIQIGSIATRLAENPDKVKNNIAFIRHAAVIYSRLMSQIMDRSFGLSSTPTLMDKVMYAQAKFFITHCMGKANDERTRNMAKAAVKNPISDVALNQIDQHFMFDQITDINHFYELMKELHPRLQKIDTRWLYHTIANWFGLMMVFSTEVPLYLVMNICSTINLAGMNNEFRLEKLMDKDGVLAYNSLIQSL